MNYTIDAKEKFIIGSRAFFEGIDGFESKDTDELWLLTEPLFGKNESFIFKNMKEGKDIILYPPFSKEEIIEYDLKSNDKIKFGKYLVPKFAEYIGLSIKDLKKVSKLMIKLDAKHVYQKIIYNAYISNGNFTLTDEQRQKAYEEYKKARTEEKAKQKVLLNSKA